MKSRLNSTWDLAYLARPGRRGLLAELRQTAGDLEGALQALEQAIAADPVAEELYRRLMRLEAEVG
jgi:hypothetical protein